MRARRAESLASPGPVLLAAIGLGISAERLLWEGPVGPGLVLWIALLGGSATLLVWTRGWTWTRATAGWSAVAVLAAAGTTWRAAPPVQLLFLVVLVLAASAALLEARGRRMGRTRVLDHMYGLALVPWRSAVGALPLLGALEPGSLGARRRTRALARGLVLAVPPVAIFAALFVAADPWFERMAMELTIGLEELPPHLFVAGVFGWISAGLLTGLFPARSRNPLRALRPPRVGIEETGMVLGLVSLLFAVFVAVQFRYLFGGMAAIEATSGLTLAEYARRGFFELVGVAALTLTLLLAFSAAAPRGIGRRVFRSLAGLLVALVMVIIASAALRLHLYVSEFGLTESRLYAAAAMGWVAVTLALFAASVLRDRPRPFASGAFMTAILTVFALAALNPHALIARTNLDRSAERPVDDAYLARLSADAVPTLMARLDDLDPGPRCRLAGALHERWAADQLREPDWRTWNLAETRARTAAAGFAGCGPPAGNAPTGT